MSNRNRKKSSKTNSSHVGKSTEKKTEYVEEVNEIILNDLVPEERRNEFGMEEVQQKTPKKKGGLNFNLGLNSKKKPTKKSSTDSKSSKSNGAKSESTKNSSNNNSHVDKHKASDSSTNSGHTSKGKHADQESTSSKGKSSKKESTSSKKDNSSSKKEKTSSKKGKNSSSTESSKSGSKKKGSTKSHSVSKEDSPDSSNHLENNKHVDEKTNHKQVSKKSAGIKKKRVHEQDEESNSKQIPLREIEDYVPVDFDIDEDQDTGRSFRSEEHIEEEPVVIEEEQANKFENLVWSEDKFPKK